MRALTPNHKLLPGFRTQFGCRRSWCRLRPLLRRDGVGFCLASRRGGGSACGFDPVQEQGCQAEEDKEAADIRKRRQDDA